MFRYPAEKQASDRFFLNWIEGISWSPSLVRLVLFQRGFKVMLKDHNQLNLTVDKFGQAR